MKYKIEYRKQLGGFLEPVQAVPPFHYTESPARKAWTKMVYPYAPYFFNMFREIPWSEWKYEDSELIARCNSHTPYLIIGGAACELLNKVYSSHLPARVRLHAHTDPTGDIDVMMPGVVIEPKKEPKGKKRQRNYTYFSDHKGTMLPYTRSYTLWLLDQIEAYFKKISYNFKEWFPTATEFVYAANVEAARAEPSTSRSVGPFRIYLSVFPQSAGEVAYMKIQVSMAHEYDGKVDQEHFIELLLSWDGPRTFDIAEPHVKLDTLGGLLVCSPTSELRRNEDGIQNRISFITKGDMSHKIKNHFGRAIFLINLLNLPHFYDELSESARRQIMLYYRNGFVKAANREEAAEYAIQMLKNCPRRFKDIEPYYTNYKAWCEEKFHMTLEECGLPAEPIKVAVANVANTRRNRGGNRGKTRRRP